jgi:GT2 family glycosyltransferase
MIRREAYLKLGGYDENYYFYNEDLDWVERAKRQGLCFMALPGAKVIHYSGRGRMQNHSRIIRELYWSNIYYFKKFYPKISWLVYRILLLELHLSISKLKKQLHKAEAQRKKEIEMEIQDLVVAQKLMKEHYRNSLEPKIPFWEEN